MIRFESEFQNIKLELVKIQVSQNGYTGNVKRLPTQSCISNKKRFSENALTGIYYDTLDLVLVSDDYNTFSEFFFGDIKQEDITIEILINNNVVWKGISIQENYSLPYQKSGFPIGFSFSNALIYQLTNNDAIKRINIGGTLFPQIGFETVENILIYISELHFNNNLTVVNNSKRRYVRQVESDTVENTDLNMLIGIENLLTENNLAQGVDIIDFIDKYTKSLGLICFFDSVNTRLIFHEVNEAINSDGKEFIKGVPVLTKDQSFKNIIIRNNFEPKNWLCFNMLETDQKDFTPSDQTETNITNFLANKYPDYNFKHIEADYKLINRFNSDMTPDLSATSLYTYKYRLDYWEFIRTQDEQWTFTFKPDNEPQYAGQAATEPFYEDQEFKPLFIPNPNQDQEQIGVGQYYATLRSPNYNFVNNENGSPESEFKRGRNVKKIKISLTAILNPYKNKTDVSGKAYKLGQYGEHIIDFGLYTFATDSEGGQYVPYDVQNDIFANFSFSSFNRMIASSTGAAFPFKVRLDASSREPQTIEIECNLPEVIGVNFNQFGLYVSPNPWRLRTYDDNGQANTGTDELRVLDMRITPLDDGLSGFPLESSRFKTEVNNQNDLQVNMPFGQYDGVTELGQNFIYQYLRQQAFTFEDLSKLGFVGVYTDRPSQGVTLPQNLPFDLIPTDIPTQRIDAISLSEFLLRLYKNQYETGAVIISANVDYRYSDDNIEKDINIGGRWYRMFDGDYDWINCMATGQFIEIRKNLN